MILFTLLEIKNIIRGDLQLLPISITTNKDLYNDYIGAHYV
jgi:hypothetical protein